MPVIGFLNTLAPNNMATNVMDEFLQGLQETGFVDGQNVRIEYRWAEGHYRSANGGLIVTASALAFLVGGIMKVTAVPEDAPRV
jgi:hypothetical protein